MARHQLVFDIVCLPECKGLWRVAILKTLSNMLVTVIISVVHPNILARVMSVLW